MSSPWDDENFKGYPAAHYCSVGSYFWGRADESQERKRDRARAAHHGLDTGDWSWYRQVCASQGFTVHTIKAESEYNARKAKEAEGARI